jgi:aminoglycoside phosphotransferase (APT) family kinase protein
LSDVPGSEDRPAPGPLIASGRDSDVYAFGHGDQLVLRRSRAGRSMAPEAKLMEYVRAHGYPVPAVDHLDSDGTDLIMERVPGPSMVELIGRKPWTLAANGALLGDLHRRLHQIPCPDWLAPGPGPEGSDLLHLDLHPLNVIMGPSGPVVIDWPNARRGQAAFDVALTWSLLMAGEIPGSRLKARVMGRFRDRLVASFLQGFDLAPVRATMRAAVDWKVTDAHISAAEQGRMQALAASAERAAPA